MLARKVRIRVGKLTALQVKNAAPGTHVDGKGLLLRVKPTGAKSWTLRVQHAGLRQDIGLGSVDDLTLAEAREKAAVLRKIARQGGDARAERDKGKVVVPTFAQAVTSTHTEKSKGWSDKTSLQFLSSLETHALPVLGRRRVDAIDGEHIIAALAPIWTTKPQIARKVRHRIIEVLAFSKARGWRAESPPPAKEITAGLAKQPESENFAAMPYREVPAYVAAQLAKADTPARLALLFTILTAARSGEVRQATWAQIDREAGEWRRPPAIMKGGKAHTVTLNRAALAILDQAQLLPGGGEGLIFPSLRGKVLTNAALGKMFRDSGRAETVHGFRSTFRDWAAEQKPEIPFAVAEMALAHKVGDRTERAYLRSDLRDLRRELMGAWGAFVASQLGSGAIG